MNAMMRRAVVLLSGGIDSATAVAIARSEGFAVYALTARYGQRHEREVEAARIVAVQLGVAEHRVVTLDPALFLGSALTAPSGDRFGATSSAETPPMTYVPARNTVLLSVALAWAESLGARDIFVGANALDAAGYPDCRPAYFEAFEAVANLGTREAIERTRPWRIRAPLTGLTKAGVLARGLQLGVDFTSTWSCYSPDSGGLACGVCDACRQRGEAFRELGYADPAPFVRSAPR